MNVIHSRKKTYIILRIFVLLLAMGLVLPNLISCANTFASFSGGGAGAAGPSNPGYEFDGLYTVEQNRTELTPDNDGVYVISDYNYAPSVWVNAEMVDSGNPVCMKSSIKVYDENDSVIEWATHTGSTTCSRYSDLNNYRYLSSQMGVDYRGKNTEYTIGLYRQGENYVPTDFLSSFTIKLAYADYDSEKIPSISISDIRQAGQHIPARYNESGYWFVETNNYLDLEMDFHVENFLEGMSFTTYMRGSNQAILDGTKSDYTLSYYAQSYSFSPYFYINYHAFDFGTESYFKNYEGHSDIMFQSSQESNQVEYFDIILVDLGTGENLNQSPNEYSDMVELDLNNYVEKSIGVKIIGHNYNNDSTYDIDLTMSSRIGEPTHLTIQKTGAELNNGVIIPYEQQIGPVTVQELMTEPVNDSGYDATCNIGYTTRGIGFWYNPINFIATADVFNSNGQSYTQYADYFSNGDAGLIYGTNSSVTIQQSLLSDELYFGLDVSGNDVDNYDVYLFRSNNNSGNNFMTKEYLSKTSISTEHPEIINVGSLPSGGTTYSAIISHNDIVDSVYHFQVKVANGYAADVTPLLFRATSDSALYITQYGLSTLMGTPTNVQVLMNNADSNKTYQLKVISWTGDFQYDGNIEGSALDGNTTLFTIPAKSSNKSWESDYYEVSIFYNNQLVAKSDLHMSYTDLESNLDYAKTYNELLDYAYDQITNQQVSAGSFSATLSAPDTFDGEFDAYLTVGNYDRIIGSCTGICGIVGELNYDHDQLELTSAEPLADFEIEQGNKIVLYKATGVADGTAIMKLHFRKKNMSAGDTTTVSFVNIEGSDGLVNIPTADTSVTTEYDIPYRYVVSHIFTPDNRQINASAGYENAAGSTNGESYYMPIDLINGKQNLTFYFDGYGFDDNTTYSYSLADANSEIATGEVSGQDFNDGKLKIDQIPYSSSNVPQYELKIYDGNTLLYTYIINCHSTNDPYLFTEVDYGYSEADVVDGSYSAPYGNDTSISVKLNNLDDTTTYQIEYSVSDYTSCTEGHTSGHYTVTCTEDNASNSAIQTITATGAEIKAGKVITISAPQSTTTKRNVLLTVRVPGNQAAIASNELNIGFVEPSNIVNDFGGHTVFNNMVLGKIGPNTTVGTLQNDFTLANGFQLSITDKDKNTMGNNALVGTGSKVFVKDGRSQSVIEYTARIKGDTSGDGKITILDLVQAKRYLAGIASLEGVYLEAGDVTNSGFIGITDVVKICRHVAGLEEIRQ